MRHNLTTNQRWLYVAAGALLIVTALAIRAAAFGSHGTGAALSAILIATGVVIAIEGFAGY